MDKSLALKALEPHKHTLVEVAQDAFADYEHIIPVDDQASLLGAHAKIVNCRLTHRAGLRSAVIPTSQFTFALFMGWKF